MNNLKKNIVTFVIIGLFLLLSVPTVLGNEKEINNEHELRKKIELFHIILCLREKKV